jgi:hypothetical protein
VSGGVLVAAVAVAVAANTGRTAAVAAANTALFATLTVIVTVIVTIAASLAVRNGWLRRPSRPGMVRGAARALPSAARARYAEEWAGELYDLRAEGARWWQHASHVVGVLLYAAPVLAVTLRLSRVRAVD